ncbi:hypothetical protein BGW38_000335 [Lunasporangiospora selenospora]|uniref:Uncharacterized protein n=1 Tax=Lunasporangiospora selenospora TaxID=979761 RepID=A0A9P6KI57_9FUNG|nr:hypothetical protein BGW38_000335 [Lunasporangiospora selenospora]
MKRKLYGAGSKMLEKLEHQETFLKEVPAKEDLAKATIVPFLYPSTLAEAKVQAEFKALVEQRIPYHRRYMIFSALWVPFTSLFTLVPLVPNIPLFYNAFRLWSHWKAYSGAKHLDLLLKNGALEYQPSDVLNYGLQHDPEFAVFFTGSNQLSIRRNPRREPYLGPIISESSGEITPTLGSDDSVNELKLDAETAVHHSSSTPKNDPYSITDHVAHEGFISNAEIQTICIQLERQSLVHEIKRARYQEAEKFVKAKLKEGGAVQKEGSDQKKQD